MENTIKRVLSLFLLSPICILAHGEKPQVVAGRATFENPDVNTQIIHAEDKTAINFEKFNIAANELTRFLQPNAKSSVLCRVTGKNPSKIAGRLEANGRLLFINPYGIVFTETARVNIGTLIASTLDIKDEDFIKDSLKFFMSPNAKNSPIVNKGNMHAVEQVVFMASQIYNQGTITAHAGKVEFLGGELITLDFDGDNLLTFAIEGPLKEGFIENSGTIKAPEVYMQLKTADELIKSVVNVNGLVEASSIRRENGIVRLVEKSSIDASEIKIAGHQIESGGKLAERANVTMTARDEVRWNKANKVGNLALQAKIIKVAAPLDCRTIEQHATGHYEIGAAMHARGDQMIYDAPVVITSNDVRLSLEMGTKLSFHRSLNAAAGLKNLCLQLDSGGGGMQFDGPIGDQHSFHLLTIGSAANVTLNGSMKVDRFIQKSGVGITNFLQPVEAPEGVEIHSAGFYATHDILVPKGHFILDASGPITFSYNPQIQAKSFQQTGKNADVVLGGNFTTSEGPISFEGKIFMHEDASLNAAHGHAPVIFYGDMNGSHTLSVFSDSFTVMGPIGLGMTPLWGLKVDCTGPIVLHDVGNGKVGVYQAIELNTKGTIHFKGTVYNAGIQKYQAGEKFDLSSGQPTTFKTQLEDAPSIAFTGGPLSMSAGTDVAFNTILGEIQLSSVQGSNTDLTALSTQGKINIGEIKGINRLTVDGQQVTVKHSIEANDVVFKGPAFFDSVNHECTVLAQKNNIHFKSSCRGNTQLRLMAPNGRIIFDGAVGERSNMRFQSLNFNAKVIAQNNALYCTGPVNYAAEAIYLGGDVVNLNNDILFNGPVIATNNLQIKSGPYRGTVHFLSTMDADKPGRTVVINNGRQGAAVVFKEDIGSKGPLADLQVTTSKLLLHNIGGSGAGVAQHLQVNVEKELKCLGTKYHAGQQTWTATNAPLGVNLALPTTTSFVTNGMPLVFAQETPLTLQPHEKAAVVFNTQGGALELAQLIGQNEQSKVDIRTGNGGAQLGEIVGKLGDLTVLGREIVLSGKIDVGSVMMEAEHGIRYKSHIEHKSVADVHPTSMNSRGRILINAKHGMVGSIESPIHVETLGPLIVGAKSFAYLEGSCAGNIPESYQKNNPRKLYFNGQDYAEQQVGRLEEQADVMSLAPDLFHGAGEGVVDGSALQPRKAPIYYEAK